MKQNRTIYNDMQSRLTNPGSRLIANPQIAVMDASIINDFKIGQSKNTYKPSYSGATVETPCGQCSSSIQQN
jgi:hypothetical protein